MPGELKWAYIVTDQGDACITPVEGTAVIAAHINKDDDGKFILEVAKFTIEKGRLDFGVPEEVEVVWYNTEGTPVSWTEGWRSHILGQLPAHDELQDVASATGHDDRYVQKNSAAVVSSIEVPSIYDSTPTLKIDVDGATLEGNWEVDGDLEVTGDLTIGETFVMTTPEEIAIYSPGDLSSTFSGIGNAEAGSPYAQVSNLETLRTEYNKLQTAFADLRDKCVAFGWCAEP